MFLCVCLSLSLSLCVCGRVPMCVLRFEEAHGVTCCDMFIQKSGCAGFVQQEACVSVFVQ